MNDKALLTGINRYQHISSLRGCLNDVRTMESLLTEVFGFSKENVRTLTDEQVTKERLLKEWRWLLKDAQPGDRLVFHCSGHGSFIDDKDGDEDDGADELFCLWDMDFDDEQTYLLDDDLRKLTAHTPQGVSLTILLDSCHSGTATRLAIGPSRIRGLATENMAPFVDLESSLARLRAGRAGARAIAADNPERLVNHVLSPVELSEARDTVLVRFVQPPPKVLAALRKGGIRKSLRTAVSDAKNAAEMNHVLLAGCKATQTSADAYLDGDFHGAFSYHLDKVVRKLGGSAESKKVIQTLAAEVSAAGFTQIPQLEPETSQGPLFGAVTALQPQPGAKPAPQPISDPTTPSRSDELRQEVVLLIRELREIIRGESELPSPRSLASKAIVYVHGICKHDAGYSDPWWQSLRPHLDPALRGQLEANRREVLWSDLVTRTRALEFAASPREMERERELADTLRDVLEDRALREAIVTVPAQREGISPTAASIHSERALLGIPGLDCVDDFAKYLLNDSIRANVQTRCLDQLRPLLQSGMEINVVSHSWGTVVAYEALRLLDNERFTGGVSNLFTVGSALSIVPVQRRLQFRDGRRPALVRQWVNLDARGDIVGGSLAALSLAVDKEFLNLHPSGCKRFLGRVSPSCAHGSYFTPENAEVNRDIFAASMGG